MCFSPPWIPPGDSQRGWVLKSWHFSCFLSVSPLHSWERGICNRSMQKRIFNVPIWAFAVVWAFPVQQEILCWTSPAEEPWHEAFQGLREAPNRTLCRQEHPWSSVTSEQGSGGCLQGLGHCSQQQQTSVSPPVAAQTVVLHRILKYKGSGSHLSSPFPWKGACANVACPDRSAVILWCCFLHLSLSYGKAPKRSQTFSSSSGNWNSFLELQRLAFLGAYDTKQQLLLANSWWKSS